MPTIKFQHSKVDPHRRGWNTDRRNLIVAVITDDAGKKWDWMHLIRKGVGNYQGPMSMLGPTHETTTYEVEGWGTVPGSLEYDTNTQEYILEQFNKRHEDFTTHR